MVFCTLFDSFYLDKGIALYRSLERYALDDFRLYVFCFDERSFEILESMHLKNIVLIHSSVFENDLMLGLKKERSKAEYCWTCTPQTIEYVLDNYGEESVTYIDADLYFFSDPQVLFDEIKDAGANVVIVEHRFSKDKRGSRLLKRSGKYCVEFNYFDQSEYSRECLNWWKEKCIEWCFHLYEPERMGDQKYLEKFPLMFKGVYELQNLGGGVAPWNLNQYLLEDYSKQGIVLSDKESNQQFDLIFYHFQNIRYIGRNHINICSGTSNKELKDCIYRPYLKEIEKIRSELKMKGIFFSTKKSYSSNYFISLFQATILRFKTRYISDIYDLRKI